MPQTAAIQEISFELWKDSALSDTEDTNAQTLTGISCDSEFSIV